MGTVGAVVEDVTGLNVSGDSQADQAVRGQENAAREASGVQRYIFDEQRKDAQPWRDAGGRALGGLENSDFQRDFTMRDFQADPGYAFRLAEGQKAIERSAAARGGLNSGATLKSLARFNQDTASQEYQNAYNRFNTDRDRRFNRLSNLAGLGQTANAQIGAAGQNYANQVGQNTMGAANARAAMTMGQNQMANQTFSQGVQAGAAYFSDARVKTNIEPITKDDLAEMKKHLKAYSFNYLSDEFGRGDWVGVMAQDLEKSRLGRTLVVENEQGLKQIDMAKVMSLFLATMAEG